jgi:L-fucose mutarotase
MYKLCRSSGAPSKPGRSVATMVDSGAFCRYRACVLRTRLQHPHILAALAAAGHGARVLICDGHYPASTQRGRHAELVSLNLSPGLVDCVDVLRALCDTVAIEAATVMAPASGPEPAVLTEFRKVLSVPLTQRSRGDFYAEACGDDVALAVQTGDTRTYANLLVTLGVLASA